MLRSFQSLPYRFPHLPVYHLRDAQFYLTMSQKPARLQVDPEQIPDDDRPPQTGHTFNIWYLKWAGGDSSSRNYTKLKFRVNIKKDSGYTKATNNSPICLFFARGCCYRGKKCPFLHRLPLDTDFGIPTQDCFGRDKTADYRDDMGGVGLLAHTNRTLYVSGIHVTDDSDSVLTRHFLEFGSIDKVKVLHGKGSAFVSFRLEAEAQFAKEAMDAQSLDGSEVLSVRWANEDPNPNAQENNKKSVEDRAMEAVRQLLKKGNPEQEPLRDRKRAKKAPEPQAQSGAASTSVGLADTPADSSVDSDETQVHQGSPFLGPARVAALEKIRLTCLLVRPMPLANIERSTNSAPSAVSLLQGYSSD